MLDSWDLGEKRDKREILDDLEEEGGKVTLEEKDDLVLTLPVLSVMMVSQYRGVDGEEMIRQQRQSSFDEKQLGIAAMNAVVGHENI